ncbi:HGGxSTG domain-containing protein [Neobacillus drentensis]|uniref:HGGxSTG domain-containing protein n=1 Tax=Neobacillus drentensis TaxID=220684 RepID=UPI002FFDD3E1
MAKGDYIKKAGRFPKLPEETQKLILEAEQARAEEKEEKLKELKKALKKQAGICGAMQGNGKICTRSPYIKEDGTTNSRCKLHGGKATGAKTKEGREKALSKLNPKARLIHGAYSKDLKDSLTQEEVEFYNTTIDWFCDSYETDPINLALLDRFLMNFIKQGRKDSADFISEKALYNDFEVKMIRFAETLGLNRRFKESKENKDNKQVIGIAALFTNDQD